MEETLKPHPGYRTISRPSLWNRQTVWGLIFLVAIFWSLSQAGVFQKTLVNDGGWTLVGRFIRASINPELSPSFLWLTLDATLSTLAFAVSGTVLSLILGFGGGILASQVWWNTVLPEQRYKHRHRLARILWLSIRAVLAFFRAIHELVWGLFFVNIIGLDPLTAVLAITVPFSAIIAKVFSEILDETPHQPLVALQNSGVSPLKAFAYSLLPQAFPDLLAYGFYRFECAIRAAAVLGMIGAGGLGYQIFLSLQTLKYEQIWTLFFALFLLNGLADFWSALLRRHLGSKVVCGTDTALALTQQDEVAGPPAARYCPEPEQSSPVVRGSLWLGFLLIPFSLWYINPNISRLFSPKTLEHLQFITQSAWPPEFAILPLAEWLRLTAVTVAMSVVAVAGAGLFGLLFSFPAANNFLLPGGLLDAGYGKVWGKLAGMILLILSRLLLLVARSIPPPIWALIFLFVLFPGILPGAAALGVYTIGVLGRLMAEVVENLDDRPLIALKAQGARGGQLFIYGVIPATTARYLGYLLYRWEETIRATVVIGLVGAGGLGNLLTGQLVAFHYPGVFATLIIFVGLTILVDLVSAAARHDFRAA